VRRLTLAGQIAVIITVAIVLAQGINLAIAVENRRSSLLGQVILPAAHRLAFAVAAPEASAAKIPIATHNKSATSKGREPKITSSFPAQSTAQRERRAEAILADAFAQQSVAVPELRAVTVKEGANREPVVLLAARLADGRWVSIESPPQQPLLPLAAMLALQALLIGLVVLVPSLLLLRRVGGSLTSLADSATDFDPRRPLAPVRERGPSDVRRLVAAVNSMQARIAAMLRERDVMLGAIGHDLRTPLTAMRLEAEAVADEEQRSALVAHIEQLHDDLEQILLLARADHSTLAAERFDLSIMVTSVAAANGIDAIHGCDTPCPVDGDERALRRALQNLVDNAIRYGKTVEIDLARDDEVASIAVNDRGPGLDAQQAAIARQPFQRLEPSRNRDTGGHGLGLAIVDTIVRAHGGRLDIIPREGGGLSAILRIPRPSNDCAGATAVDSGPPLP
jgi:signal transduction histidine kinase